MSALRSADNVPFGQAARRPSGGARAASAPERVERGGVERDGRDLRQPAVPDNAEERLVDVDRPAFALTAGSVDGDGPVVVGDNVLKLRAVRAVRQHARLAEE